MKILIFFCLFFLIIISLSFQVNIKKECLIIPHKGINNIVVEKSTMKDVIVDFGKTKVNKKWRKRMEVELIGHYEYFLNYDSLGVIFSTYYPKENNSLVMTIDLESDCKCKTKNGVGIGSSYSEVIKEFGEGGSWGLNDSRIALFYDNMYVIFNSRDTLTCKVSKIIFGNPSTVKY